jgi:hypothetical protein
MSVINPANDIQFKSTDALFARVRKRLRSYDMAGVLDEGDWYWYVKEVLDSLGVAVYREAEAITYAKDFKAPLPEDFSTLYAAYKCTPDSGTSKSTKTRLQGTVMYLEHSCQSYNKTRSCGADKIVYGDKITTQYIVEGVPTTTNFTKSPFLLSLAGNVRGVCDSNCANLRAKSSEHISIQKPFIYTNFDDAIYLKYFAFPLDPETGLPEIPDVSVIEKAIETYIIYSVFNDFVINGEIPDIERKYGLVKQQADEAYANARTYVKMPSFQNIINKIRKDRKNLDFYQI